MGLVPPWSKDGAIGDRLVNARAETVMEKPAFREAFRSRRCIVPVDSIDRWGGGAMRHYQIRRKDDDTMGIAGLWGVWTDPANGDEVTTFVVITCPANALLAPLHDRMAVILDPKDYDTWLELDCNAAELLRPCSEDWLEVVPVGRRQRKDGSHVRKDDGEPTSQGELFSG